MSTEQTILFHDLERENVPPAGELSRVREFSYFLFDNHVVDRPCFRDMELLIVVFRGKGVYTHGEETVEGARGSVILYRRGEWQKYHAQGRYEGIGLHFHIGPGLDAALKHYGVSGGRVFPSLLSEYQLAELNEVFAYPHLPQTVAFHKMDILVERLILLALPDHPEHRQTPHHMRMEDVRRYIQQHPEGDLSIATLARSANLSPSWFAAVFRKEFGDSIGAFIRRTRLDYARHMLQSTSLTAAELATRLGYATPFAFYAAFKAHHGKPPGKARKH